MSEIWDTPSPTNRGSKNHLFGPTSQPNGNFNGLYLRNETWYRQSIKCVDNYKGSPTSSQNVMNVMSKCPQTAPNSTAIFTHPLLILHYASLSGFADGDQQTELNQTLPTNGQSVAQTNCRTELGAVPPTKIGAKKLLHLLRFSTTSTLSGEYLLKETWQI